MENIDFFNLGNAGIWQTRLFKINDKNVVISSADKYFDHYGKMRKILERIKKIKKINEIGTDREGWDAFWNSNTHKYVIPKALKNNIMFVHITQSLTHDIKSEDGTPKNNIIVVYVSIN